MRLLNPLALARDLRDDRVSEATKARLMALGILGQVFTQASRSAYPAPADRTGSYLLVAALTCAGIYLCYRANAARDDRRFVERFVCLSVPLSIGSMVASIASAMTLTYGLGMDGAAYARVCKIVNWTLWVLYFAALWRLIQVAATRDLAEPPPLPRHA